MRVFAAVAGVIMVVAVLADMVNTLVTTSTSNNKWWLTQRLYQITWRATAGLARVMRSDPARERLLATFAPVSVLMLLGVWVTQQIVGFGLLWWAVGGVEGASDLWDAVYFSGVVYFTLGFGELVPIKVIPRAGVLIEALSGVLTTALVIGYLPALYAAYSERERHLLTLDDGTETRITPTNLLLSRTPDADIGAMDGFFQSWEAWIAGVIETHSTFPMLVLFRSKDPGQHWVTALGLVSDAALQCQLIEGARGRSSYWMLRRAIRLFDQLTAQVDLSGYRTGAPQLEDASEDERSRLFQDLYQQLEDHGFDLVPYEQALEVVAPLRRRYAAALEFLIDELLAPRGFWGHAVGHRADWYAPQLPES